MFSITSSLAIQSWCFRDFKDNRQVTEKLRACGVSAVELCGVHADFTQQETFDDVIRVYRDAGIAIVSLGVNTAAQGEEPLRLQAEFARRAGAKFMSIGSQPDAHPGCWTMAAKVAEDFGLRFGIHNHGGYDWLGGSQMLGHILKNSSDRIGLCVDTAWTLDAGEDPLKWFEKFPDRIFGLHLKDFTFDRARRPTDVIIGTGNIDLPALLKAAKSLPNLGYAVIEYEGEPENPVPSLVKCVEAAHQAAA